MPWAEQLPSGKYRALYRDNAGKRRSAGTYPHKRAAEKAAAVAEDGARKLGWRDPDAAARTWGDWAEEWLHTRQVEPGTAKRDRYRIDRHVRPRWHDVPLGAITRHDVRSWVSSMTGAPSSSQRNVYLLSASLNAAIDAEILTTNPAARIKITTGETETMRFLSRAEFSTVIEEMRTLRDAALVAFLAGTGARWGEAAGLQPRRVDVERGSVRIAEVWDDAMTRVKPYPKGRRIRSVPIPDWVIDLMLPLLDGPLVFSDHERPVSLSNWRNRVWTPALQRAGVGHVRIHDLRHTYASWLIQAGVPLAEVGRMLGHISPSTTQRYAHLADVDRSQIVAALTDPRGANVGQTVTAGRYAALAPTASNFPQELPSRLSGDAPLRGTSPRRALL